MKKLIFVLLTIFAVFSITSCDLFDEGGGKENIYTTGSTRKFWALNSSIKPAAFYQLTAERLAENSRCEVWAEKGSGVTAATAKMIADEYANNIYIKMMDNFGWQENLKLSNGQYIPMNTMEFAHALATGNIFGAKLTILLLDIKDGYQPGVNDSYVAGYFLNIDFYPNSELIKQGYKDYKSNELDMIYIDVYPGLKNEAGRKEAYSTLAHEMQHLMNFTSTNFYRNAPMDLWIDEGLSSAAEWVYSNRYSPERVGWYYYNGDNDKMKGQINEGNNFFIWGNRESDSGTYPTLDDYATVYMFFQWIRLQSKTGIYKEIIKSEDNDYEAVRKAFNKITTGTTYTKWENMFEDWLKANNINSPSGRYGYNDPDLKDFIISHYAPTGTTPKTITLYPGEGVYSYSDTAPSYSPSGNIKYEYLSGTKTLITYNLNYDFNKNVDINDLTENGQITGKKPTVNIISGNLNLKLGSSKISGPFPIGIGDVIRMNNNGNRINIDSLKIEKVFIDE